MTFVRAAALAVGLIVAAAPAAAMTTIATFTTPTRGANVRWQGSGANGQFFTIATSSAAVPGAAAVDFSFLMPSIAPYVTNLPALMTFNASVTASPASPLFGQFFQGDLVGSFAFTTTTALTIGSVTYAAGSNLLSGNFSDTIIYGAANGSVATLLGDTGGGSIVAMSSAFLDFTGVNNYNINLALSALSPGIAASAGNALRSFTATANGAFASDVPTVVPIPEPESWALLITGFALVGITVRRRAAVAA